MAYLFIMDKRHIWVERQLFETIRYKAKLPEAIVFKNMNSHDFQEGTNLGI